jgi:hypothetical protein
LAHYPDALRFVRDHVPELWPAIERCRQTFRYKRWSQDGSWWTATPFSCHEVPWCILCTKAENYRRTKEAMDTLHLATPAGEQPRFYHIVQTAPLTQDGRGWGKLASQDVANFSLAVWKLTKEFYGDGIGTIQSYQDFGERTFAKRHPHIDYSLNGSRVLDGLATPVRRIELRDGGLERWHDRFLALVADLLPGAVVRDERGAWQGNVRFIGVRVGVHNYWGALRYQLRELVDVRKLDYDAAKAAVYWRDYSLPVRQKFTVAEFFYGLHEYQKRLGTWGAPGRKALHRRYGIVSDRLLDKTASGIGGVPVPHGEGCPCPDCQDWERVILDDVDREVGAPVPRL